MKRTKVFSTLMAVALLGSCTLTACKKDDNTNGSKLDNEESPLVISSEALDAVFNPYFYTAGADGDVVGQTQIGMLSTDESAKDNPDGAYIACGDDFPCVVKEYTVETFGSASSPDKDNYYTTYSFAIKNGIKFSDGSDLTIKDVLFNMYVLLDPAYTGSSTLYSVDIKGLTEYRTQSTDSSEQSDKIYYAEARIRIGVITAWCDEAIELQNPNEFDAKYEELKEIDAECKAGSNPYSPLEYIETAKKMFLDELNSDWTSAESAAASEEHEYHKYGITEAWQFFLADHGLITLNDKEVGGQTVYEVEWNGYDEAGVPHDKEGLVNRVYESMVGDDAKAYLPTYAKGVKAIVDGGWKTASDMLEYIKDKAKEQMIGDKTVAKDVSGITVDLKENLKENKTVLGTQAGKQKTLDGKYDVLKVTINGVDPKAIYNLSFTVGPMNYYSNAEEIAKFDIAAGNFGVKFMNRDFFDEMKQKQVPVGAGPYMATNSATNANGVPAKSEFFKDNIVYFERNPYFYTVGGSASEAEAESSNAEIRNAKIKKLRYKVIATTQLFDAITGANPEVHYGSPTAKQSYINNLSTMSANYGYQLADNMGYGYIGVNAGKIPDVRIRRAIMHAMNISLCMDYYGDTSLAQLIYRPMSLNNWAYPEDAKTADSATYQFDESGKTSENLAIEAGYTDLGTDGVRKNSRGDKLKFTFTIAGESPDHPAYAIMQKAADVLNSVGFDITVTTDSNALKKLASGGLEVWAAAWSSTIDPDMYQVYHKDSSASSTKNWGYNVIYDETLWSKNKITNKMPTDEAYAEYKYEKSIIESLSTQIMRGRTTTKQTIRASIYNTCLDYVMDLAVELPTYQRKNMFVYDKTYIDESTMSKASAYEFPLGKIWNVSLKVN